MLFQLILFSFVVVGHTITNAPTSAPTYAANIPILALWGRNTEGFDVQLNSTNKSYLNMADFSNYRFKIFNISSSPKVNNTTVSIYNTNQMAPYTIHSFEIPNTFEFYFNVNYQPPSDNVNCCTFNIERNLSHSPIKYAYAQLIHLRTLSPTHSTTISPTYFPSESPSKSPSQSPSGSPSQSPTGSPSQSPSNRPTTNPTVSCDGHLNLHVTNVNDYNVQLSTTVNFTFSFLFWTQKFIPLIGYKNITKSCDYILPCFLNESFCENYICYPRISKVKIEYEPYTRSPTLSPTTKFSTTSSTTQPPTKSVSIEVEEILYDSHLPVWNYEITRDVGFNHTFVQLGTYTMSFENYGLTKKIKVIGDCTRSPTLSPSFFPTDTPSYHPTFSPTESTFSPTFSTVVENKKTKISFDVGLGIYVSAIVLVIVFYIFIKHFSNENRKGYLKIQGSKKTKKKSLL